MDRKECIVVVVIVVELMRNISHVPNLRTYRYLYLDIFEIPLQRNRRRIFRLEMPNELEYLTMFCEKCFNLRGNVHRGICRDSAMEIISTARETGSTNEIYFQTG